MTGAVGMGPLGNGCSPVSGDEEATVEERWGEVFRRLGVVEASVAGQTAQIGGFMRRAEKTLDDIDATLHGADGRAGLAIRVDRLEQARIADVVQATTAATSAARQRGYLWAVVVVVAGGMLLTRIEACERLVHDGQPPKPPQAGAGRP